MYNYYERTYYTLDDIRIEIGISPNDKGPYTIANSSAASLSSFLMNCFYKLHFSLPPTLTETDEARTCFKEYIWPRFYQEAIIYTDLDENEDFVEKFCRTKSGQILSWWTASMDKYSLLIQNLKANKKKLLYDVKSASISRSNDTPQNSGDFSDDNHTSTVTKTENSSNVGTMMARLNEIEDNIKQLYIDWSNEFRKFIIWSVNN